MTSNIRVSAYLTPEQIEMIKNLKEKTMAEHIRNAIDLYLSTKAHSLKDTRVRYEIEQPE